MQNNNLLIVAICGVCAVVGGVFVLGAFLVLKITWRGALPPFIGLLLRTSQNQDEVAEPYIAAPRHVDLRARADALNFDDAVEKYTHEQPGHSHPVEPPSFSGVQLPPSQFDSLLDQPSAQSLRKQRRSEKDQEEEIDHEELFHDFLDMDEGGE